LQKLFAATMKEMPWPGAVAVSGGGDSLALMHLLTGWTRSRRVPPPLVFTVDHGLRPQSGADARKVARWAKAAGLDCEILTIKGKKPKTGIEAWAREKRYHLMAKALARRGLKALYLGHTEDDQAETFLMRLSRGSGLDGLGGMRGLAPFPFAGLESFTLARPLLTVPRLSLRDYLNGCGQAWLEDPMNSEARFTRSRMRALLPPLTAAGLPPRRIAQAADHLARAREALDLVTAAVLARACQPKEVGPKEFSNDAWLLDPEALTAAPREIGLRALAALLQKVSGEGYRPRFDSLEQLFDRLCDGKGATLHGCHIAPAPRRGQVFGPKTLVIMKESSRGPVKQA
jgi:tRNA(Ile)-lysidine synthase